MTNIFICGKIFLLFWRKHNMVNTDYLYDHTFFEKYFSFFPFGRKRGNLGQNPGDFWGKTGRRKRKGKIMFFPYKEKKKRRKPQTARRAAGCVGGRKHQTLRRAHLWITIIIHNSAPKMAICLWITVDNSVENPIFQ